MPHPMTIVQAGELAQQYVELDALRIARPEIGQLGLPTLEEIIKQFRRETKLIHDVGEYANENQLNQALSAYRDYLRTLYSLNSASHQDYVEKRGTYGEELRTKWDSTREIWPVFAAIYADRKAFLSPEDAHLKQIETASNEAMARISKGATESLANAKLEANRIIDSARATVRGFSVKAAQDQFDDASSALKWKALAWGILGALAFLWFLCFAYLIYRQSSNFSLITSKPISGPIIAYMAAVRVTILTAIGALVTFCMKMLRAHLHMSEVNNHRRRLANSMAAFVESAQTPEQRDQIFMRLVEAVAEFGDSGLLNREAEGLSVPSVAIEAITKNLTTK